jgi:F-type H+-transporting ATPase subunit b
MDFLNNTDIVVAIGFLIFVGVLIYFGVPRLLTTRLDARAAQISADIAEAKSLREEAEVLLKGYERKQKEVAGQAEAIVAAARREAEQAAEQAKADIGKSVARRLQAATEQIAAAEQAAVREIRDRAAALAVAAAGDVIRASMGGEQADAMVEAAIREVGAKLH